MECRTIRWTRRLNYNLMRYPYNCVTDFEYTCVKSKNKGKNGIGGREPSPRTEHGRTRVKKVRIFTGKTSLQNVISLNRPIIETV